MERPIMNMLVLLLLITPAAQAQQALRLNQLQGVATHNSYKQPMDGPVMQRVMAVDSSQGRSLDYAHPRLTEQLDLGVRGLEIDVLYDPEGGRYRDPYGLRMQRAAGLSPVPLDTALMDRPGFKVLHVQDLDYRSSCATFRHCLVELSDWSRDHPDHLPVLISINAKEGGIDRPGFTPALDFDEAAFAALDEEILSILPAENLITPATVRDTFATLRAAVLAGNWPLLEASRGKFLFVLDGGVEQTMVYTMGHPSLAGRTMFVATNPEADEAAVLFMNEPLGNEAGIRDLVGRGFLVRSRADAGTEEARAGDYSRLEAAITSGAHYISTDYELPDPRFGTGYRVRLPEGVMVRCNPVTGGADCTDPVKLVR